MVKGQQQQGPSLLEWIAAALGLLVTTGLLVFLGLEAAQSGSSQPPLLNVRPVAVTNQAGGYVLEVQVANRSGQTATAVNIEGELSRGGRAVETSSAILDYVPAHSERKAGLMFSEDPRKLQLKLRPTGYAEP